MCGNVGVRTGTVLRIQNEHFIERPAAVRDEFVAFRSVTATTLASDQYGVVEKYEPYGTCGLVGCCVKNRYVVHLCDDMTARRRRHKFGRAFDLGMQILYLIRVEHTQISDGRADIASAV